MNAAAQLPPRHSSPALMSLDEALALILDGREPLLPVESVPTLDADGRVLREDVVSSLAVPALDNSAMDGYAVRCAELGTDGASVPISQRIAAGQVPLPLQPGTVARIFTGAAIPAGADAVLMQEDAEMVEGQRMRCLRLPALGQSIRRVGEDVALGSAVLRKGRRLGAADLGLAASVGQARLTVGCRPRVALLSTGDELVMPGEVAPQDMPAGSIYNSNRFFLRALLQRLGCAVTDLGAVPDRFDATVSALRNAAQSHDLILSSGGVSVGEEDHVKAAVQSLGELNLWQVAIKPGKPFAFGRVGPTRFMGLPGNPVSSWVTALTLVRPWLLRMQGVSEPLPTPQWTTAAFDWPRPDRRREFLRVRRQADGRLALYPKQGSGVLTSVVWSDGLVDNPPGQAIAAGDMVRYLSLNELLA